jgi:site-specific recombinase XerD
VSGSRATQENVAAYVDFLDAQGVAPQSQAMLLAQLQGVLRAFAPTEDRPWLKRSIRRLQARKVPVRDKIRRLRPAAEILTWALGELDQIKDGPQRLRSPIRFRDVLTVALLIACPTMRLSNLASIRIGVHLRQRGGKFELRFEAQEMKGRKAVSIPVPLVLTPYIEHYIETMRGLIAPRADATALWISKTGRPMTERLLHQQISRTTRLAFGQSINPHLFRDCAASHVAAEDPEAIATAAHVLGHSCLVTTEAHYIHRQTLAAGSRYHESLREVRSKLKPASGQETSA